MEWRSLTVVPALYLLLVGTARAADPPPQCRCLSNMFTATMNLNQGMKIGNGGPGDLVQHATGTQYGDLHKGWIVSVFDMVPGGQVTMYQELGASFWYINSAAGCQKMKAMFVIPKGPHCWFNQTDFEFKGTETLGKGNDVEVWQTTDTSSGFFMKQFLSEVSAAGDCFPVYQTLATQVEGFAFSQGLLLTDYQGSVDDPSVFDFPAACKDAEPMQMPLASGAQVKTMSVLALALMFVLHLLHL